MNQIYINAGFNSNKNDLCKAAADAAFASYVLIQLSVCMFLWFRQKAFYSNNMLAFRTTKFIRALSYSSVFFINTSAVIFIFLYIIQENYKASISGCYYEPENNVDTFFGISAIILIVLWQTLLLCLFIYPVLQIRRDSETKMFFVNKSDVKKSGIGPTTKSSHSNSATSISFSRAASITVRPPSDGIKVIIRKTLFFAVASTLVDVILSVISYFLYKPSSNWRLLNMVINIASFF